MKNHIILINNVADPKTPPSIQPNYLQHPADATVLAAGLRWMGRLTQSKFVKDKFGERVYPSPSLNLEDLEQAKKAVYEVVAGQYHPCGSVAMGDALDSHLRVKGVQCLRVADASVFPNAVSGNIQSSVYCVAEKAADMIKEDWDFAPLQNVTQ